MYIHIAYIHTYGIYLLTYLLCTYININKNTLYAFVEMLQTNPNEVRRPYYTLMYKLQYNSMFKLA